MTLIGVKAETEVHTSDGRLDLIVKTRKYIYIFELKFDKSSEDAMKQIKEKNYALSYLNDKRHIFLVGLNFSSKTRHLDDPIIVELDK